MKSEIHFQSNQKKPSKFLPGLEGLERYVDHDLMVYILRSLYRSVFKSRALGENKHQLLTRVKKFEEECHLPGFLSSMPVGELLAELEDAQYYYPIQKREVNFPKFH